MTKRERYPGLALLAKRRTLVAPRDISKIRARKLMSLGFATGYEFWQRWNLKIDITEAGDAAAKGEAK